MPRPTAWLRLVAAIVLLTQSLSLSAAPPTTLAPEKTPIPVKEKTVEVVIETSLGNIEAELNNEKAPISTKNFLNYVDSKYYENTVFHRVIKNFMIQGGGFTPDLKVKPTDAPIKNEASNGLQNLRGTLAMARTPIVDSATSQFFINHADNGFLDHKNPTPEGFGYAVFGRVTKGLDVVDKIAAVTTASAQGMQDVPAVPVVIKAIKRKKDWLLEQKEKPTVEKAAAKINDDNQKK